MVKSGGLKYVNFLKGIKLNFICMKMKLMIFAAKIFKLGTCTPNYSRFYVKG